MSSADAIDAEAFQKLNPKEFVRKFVEAGTRPDGRHAQRIRHTVISTGALGMRARALAAVTLMERMPRNVRVCQAPSPPRTGRPWCALATRRWWPA